MRNGNRKIYMMTMKETPVALNRFSILCICFVVVVVFFYASFLIHFDLSKFLAYDLMMNDKSSFHIFSLSLPNPRLPNEIPSFCFASCSVQNTINCNRLWTEFFLKKPVNKNSPPIRESSKHNND